MRIKRIFSPPVFRDEERTRSAGILNTMQWLALGCLGVIFITLVSRQEMNTLPTIAWMGLFVAMTLWLNHRGYTFMAAVIFLGALLGGVTLRLQHTNGIHDIMLLVYVTIIVLSSLILDRRNFVFFILLVLACLGWLVFGEIAGKFVTPFVSLTDSSDFVLIGVILVLTAVAVRLMADRQVRSVKTAKRELAAHQKAQAALKQTQDLLAAISNNSLAVIYVKDLKGVYLLVNKQFERIFGLTQEQIIGHDDYVIYPRAVAETLRANDAQVIAARQTINLKETIPQIDGIHTYISAKFPLFDASGEPYALAGISTDITERQRADDALRVSEEKFSKAFRTSPDSININRLADGQYLEINQGFTTLMGYTAEEAIGKTSLELDIWVDPQERARLVDGLRTNGEVRNLEARFRRKNGEIAIALMSATLIEINGEMCILSLTHEITERRQAEDDIRSLNAELEQRVARRTAELEAANRELEAFAYSVSHDLRTPLRAIDGFSKILLEENQGKLDEQSLAWLARIRVGAQRMDEIIQDLLNFSRLSRQPLNKQLVCTHELVADVLRELLSGREQRSIEWQIGELLDCQADPSLLRQVYLNLLDNAIKYTRQRQPAQVEVGCQHNGGETIYFVRDNGAGFDMQFIGKLFGVFQRLHRDDEFEGTGIGLATVQRVIHRHGGRVWAEAEVDKGATFYFTLGE
jgi:PAS domain S-box-containing protein